MQDHNYMEDILDEVLKTVLPKRDDICKCEHCVSGIKKYVLNRLMPKYIHTLIDTAQARTQTVDNQFKVDVTREITFAIDHVKKHNFH